MNFYLVNGFLGSGKTTAIANACKLLTAQSMKVAVITNDQGTQQVDSAYMQALTLPNAEVVNGCFCCRYNELEKAIAALKISAQPEIIFAESVGSCTDLIATIVKPFLLNHYKTKVVISVFADACLLHSIMKGNACFIEDAIQYIYKKQLEEADILIINKTDLLEKEELLYVKQIIEASYPAKKIIFQNSYNENDLYNWLQLLKTFTVPDHRCSLDIDYNTYASGEAALAWLDQKISIHTINPVAADTALQLTDSIYEKIKFAGYAIGHLKFLLSNDEWQQKISYTTNYRKEQTIAPVHNCKHIGLLINARVQASPAQLQSLITNTIHEAIMQTGCRIVKHKSSAFQPGYPKPVHRIAE